jgi:2-dehydropantoate 2-reductase
MPLKIAVLGSGGIGGYFGGRLAAAGEDVTFIARGAHLEAMRANGLAIESPLGDARIDAVKATDDPKEIGPADVVMFCVKLYDVESAAQTCRPLVGPNTVVITFQNGVDTPERVAGVLGKDHVAGGVARIPSNIKAPGVIAHVGKFASLEFAELDGRESPRLRAFADACASAGIDAKLVDSIERALWDKFAMLATFAGVACVTRQPAGVINGDADLRQLFADTLDELLAVAKARGVEMSPGIREDVLKIFGGFPGKPSMLHDLERGKALELDGLTGTIVRLGAELGVPTPVNRTIYAALKPFRDGAPA